MGQKRKVKHVVYGVGGYDPTKPNDNVVAVEELEEEVADPTPSAMQLQMAELTTAVETLKPAASPTSTVHNELRTLAHEAIAISTTVAEAIQGLQGVPAAVAQSVIAQRQELAEKEAQMSARLDAAGVKVQMLVDTLQAQVVRADARTAAAEEKLAAVGDLRAHLIAVDERVGAVLPRIVAMEAQLSELGVLVVALSKGGGKK